MSPAAVIPSTPHASQRGGAAAAAAAAAVPQAVLDDLAARFRAGGLCLVLLKPDGSVVYHDASAGAFFQKFARPLIEQPGPAATALREKIRLTHAATGVTPWAGIPGVEAAAFPFVEKRQLTGVLLLAGKSTQFKLGEDVLRACSTLGLDAAWLAQQAEELPAYDARSVQQQAGLLFASVRDQLRVAALQQELDSLSGQLSNTYEELSLIYQISSGMKVNRRWGDFFKQTCLDVMQVLNVRGMGVVLCTDDAAASADPAIYGRMALTPQKLKHLGAELIRVLRERKSVLLCSDLSRDKTFKWLAEDARQLLAVPLQRQDEVLGCLFGLDKESGEFDSVDAKLLNSIANESAIYLENARLFEDVHGLMMGLLHALTSAVDAKDAYTCGHSERVALLSQRLAREIHLPEPQVERIYMAGLLHDVGKIGVPESVLQKAGRLTPEEFEHMKKHPAIGAKILSDIKQIEDVIPGVMHHHERYDGKGYPAGLAGRNIPLMGRIICLADCFDAMTSNRTYRRALPLEVALVEIRRCSGSQFDPSLAEAFLQIEANEFREILKDHHLQARKRLEIQEALRVA
jgi:putative nucleotidyltransferase with HDIG domain